MRSEKLLLLIEFSIKVRGLQPCGVYSLIMFEDGSKVSCKMSADLSCALPWLQSISSVWWLSCNTRALVTVGKDFVGRVVSVTGEPLDGKGPIAADAVWPVFNSAPPLYDRQLVDDQLESGITAVDSLFPLYGANVWPYSVTVNPVKVL